MSADAWLTLAVIAAVLVLLVRGRVSPAVVVFGGTVTLLVLEVVDVEGAFSGFSNPAPITVAALYVLAAGIEKTGALTPVMQATLGERGKYRRPLLRTLVPTVGASAFLNNTPIVAMLIPQITTWANRRGVAVSKLLMPVSFAAILGGLLTVIGTSTSPVRWPASACARSASSRSGCSACRSPWRGCCSWWHSPRESCRTGARPAPR